MSARDDRRALAHKFGLTSVASMVAEGSMYPVELTKTRLQLQGEPGFGAGRKFGFFGMMRHIARTEGVLGLYAGFSPGLARHIPYTGFRMVGYEARSRRRALRRVPQHAA